MLPAAVSKKADRAAELIRAASGEPNPETPAPGNGSPPPGADPDAAKALAEKEAEIKGLQEANARLEERNRHRVQSEEGRQTKELRERIKELEEAAAKTPHAPPGELTSLTDEERNLLGPDVVRVIGKAAREVVGSEIEIRLKPVTKSIADFRSMTEGQYIATLDLLVPGWEKQNDDHKFLSWLQEIDPATNKLRQDLIRQADASQQGYVTAEIFLAFRENREIGVRTPAPVVVQPDISPPPGGGSGLPAADTGAEGTIWTRGEIAQFYSDKRQGRYRGRPEECKRLEQDILNASREGRIRA
jgi:hypothetical protein